MHSFHEIEQELNEIKNIPTISVVASKLLDQLVDENISMNKISQLMKLDPAITAKVLKIVNSAYYGLRKEIDTLHMALVLPGINEVSKIVMSLSIFRAVGVTEGEKTELDRKKFWEHSAQTAYLSTFLCREFRIPVHGEEFTSGLIHDIGKIILDQHYHQDFAMITDIMKKKGLSACDAESMILGATHSQIGAWLAKKWKFPRRLIDVIEYHHNFHNAEENKDLIAVVSLSNILSHQLGDSGNNIYKNHDVEKSETWKHLKDKNPSIDLKKIKPDLEKELNRAKEFLSSALK